MNHFSGMTRREFARLLGTASALGVVESQLVTMALADNKRSLNYLANRTAGAEGNWELKKIEGKVPKALNGTLIRTAPGQKENLRCAAATSVRWRCVFVEAHVSRRQSVVAGALP